MPHREAAWALLAERLDEAAWLCYELQAGRGQRIAGQLEPVLAAMREIVADPGRAPARRAARMPGWLSPRPSSGRTSSTRSG